MEKGKGKNVEERKAIVIYGLLAKLQPRFLGALKPQSGVMQRCDIIAFLVTEPKGSEVQNWRAPVKPAS